MKYVITLHTEEHEFTSAAGAGQSPGAAVAEALAGCERAATVDGDCLVVLDTLEGEERYPHRPGQGPIGELLDATMRYAETEVHGAELRGDLVACYRIEGAPLTAIGIALVSTIDMQLPLYVVRTSAEGA